MELHPNSCFPLLASDQAEVIRIFLELMTEGDHAGRACDVGTPNQSFEPHRDIDGSFFPGEPHDLA
jgi:hypothetical protein